VVGESYTDTDPTLVNGRPMTYAVVPLFRTPGGSLVEGLVAPFQAMPVRPPPGFEGCSIGEGARCGSVETDPATGVITLRSSGWDIWAGYDGCYFLCQPLPGDGEITVQMLDRPSRVDGYTQAGLMVRASLATDSRHMSVLAFAAHGLMCRLRPNEGDATDTEDVLPDASLRMPISLRLTRRGDTITAAYAPPGSHEFVPAGEPVRFEAGLPKTVYVGLVGSAHNAELNSDKVTTVKFRDLKVQRH